LKLPIIFVCENNLYSSHIRLDERRLVDNLVGFAGPVGIPGIRADGNNLFEVYHVAKEAVERARSGRGPSLLELRTYRRHGHVGANLDLEKGIRNHMEFDLWQDRDPLRSFRQTLLAHGALDEALSEQIDEQVKTEVAAGIQEARTAPKPSPADLLKNTLTWKAEPLPDAPPLRGRGDGKAAGDR